MTNPVFSFDEWERLIEYLRLPPQQAAILEGLFQGMSDKQLAERLGIAAPTVRSYLQRIYARSGVQDRTALVVHAFTMFRRMSSKSMSSETMASD